MKNQSISVFLRSALGLVLLFSYLSGEVSPASAAAVRCYVKADATGLRNGSSWKDAYISVQRVLGPSPCTEVWVAKGTYKPTATTNRAISFVLKSGVAIYGGFAGTETLLSQRNPTANPTILSGEIGAAGTADNSYHVVVGSGTNSTALLDGFTITGGNANDPGYVHVDGGGMYSYEGSPTLTNVTFSANSAGSGGGMYSDSGYGDSGSPTLTKVSFSGNSADGGGGGMFNFSGSPILTNVSFSGNTAEHGGGMYNNIGGDARLANVTFTANSATAGGGMYNYASRPGLRNVIFSGNQAKYGGGIYNEESAPSLTNVIFSSNSAQYGGGMYNYFFGSGPKLMNVTFSGNSAQDGGGLYSGYYSGSILKNVTFSGNLASARGGGMYNDSDSRSNLTNVTFSGNSATIGGGIYNTGYDTELLITNSILYGDAGGEILNDSISPTVSYSIIQGGYAGTGNLDADPLLSALANNGGFTQTQAVGFGSPAIDKGTNTGCPAKDQRGVIRPQGPRCDMGAYEYRQSRLSRSSAGAEDGWVLESAELSNQGGAMNATGATFALGDDALDRQYRAILSFNTAGLPDTAVITSVTLKLRSAGVAGTNPFLTHGNIRVDVRRGAFATTAALEIQDFQATANQNAAIVIKNNPVNGWYSNTMGAASFVYINKTGLTQFRLRFAKDDNDDMSADYLKFHSGNSLTAAYRPALIIQYYVP